MPRSVPHERLNILLALIGYTMEQDMAASHQSGFENHLTCPVRIQSLEIALAAVLAKVKAMTG